jgi:hypothetical protein
MGDFCLAMSHPPFDHETVSRFAQLSFLESSMIFEPFTPKLHVLWIAAFPGWTG